MAFESSALSFAFSSELDSSSPHIKIQSPNFFQPSSPTFSLDSELKFLGSIKSEDISSSLNELESSPFNISPPACSHQPNLDEVQELDSSSSIIQVSLETPPSPQEFHFKTLQKRKPNNINTKYPLFPQKRICYK
ncbi:hypothetical protein O181_042617 [Austropuccinia psidii MF-1]|uniref:Uncharacterized protein n=1 Tax=Austropuccinia psidii MF-1 TaxID=1389203 RepID=A0A9Q3HG11_9BASI|nr:hypothetical protein [Austropuccinia psidii MF-1]